MVNHYANHVIFKDIHHLLQDIPKIKLTIATLEQLALFFKARKKAS